MSYVNLVNQNCAGFTEEAFQRMRDFICKRNGTYDYLTTGIGWTLHDSHYTVDEDNCQIGDWFVVKSVGEDGKQDLYYKFKWHEADHISFQGMLYWNAATDTPVVPYPTTDTSDVLMCDDDLAFPLWIYGDLDQVAIITKMPTNYYGALLGTVRDLPYDTTLATCAGALSSGSDISIIVDIALPSEWAVDRYLFIRDTAGIDKIKIKTLNAGTKTITADLAHSFLAGSKLCADLCYQVSVANQFGATPYGLINHAGTEATQLYKITSSLSTYSNPDEMNQEPVGECIVVATNSIGYMGKIKNAYKLGAIPGMTSEDVYTDLDGTDWRVFYFYSNYWAMIKEV